MPEGSIFNFVEKDQAAKIKVIGAGGAGGNAVNNMIEAGLEGVKFIVANTDIQALEHSRAPLKIQIGERITEGLGAGADPETGREAAQESREALRNALEGSHMVFITAGLGGGTGTGAAPVIAEICKELGILTVGVVSKPFLFEGPKRAKMANMGLKLLKEKADTVITIPNDRLRSLADPDTKFIDMFKKADEILLHSVKGITDLIVKPGYVNLDFADVRTTMSKAGMALMGIGEGSTERDKDERAIKAAERAFQHPLLEDISISGARGVLMNITCGSDLRMSEMTEACDRIYKEAGDDAEIIWGHVIDENLGDEIHITLIATGIGDEDMKLPKPKTRVKEKQEPVNETRPANNTIKLSINENTTRGVVRDLTPEELGQTNSDWDMPAYIRKRRGPASAATAAAVAPSIEQRTQAVASPKYRTNLDYDELDKPTFMRVPRD